MRNETTYLRGVAACIVAFCARRDIKPLKPCYTTRRMEHYYDLQQKCIALGATPCNGKKARLAKTVKDAERAGASIQSPVRSRADSRQTRSVSRSPSKQTRAVSRSPSKQTRAVSRSPSKQTRAVSRSPSKQTRAVSRSPSKQTREVSRSPARQTREVSPSQRTHAATPLRQARAISRSRSSQDRSGSRSLSRGSDSRSRDSYDSDDDLLWNSRARSRSASGSERDMMDWESLHSYHPSRERASFMPRYSGSIWRGGDYEANQAAPSIRDASTKLAGPTIEPNARIAKSLEDAGYPSKSGYYPRASSSEFDASVVRALEEARKKVKIPARYLLEPKEREARMKLIGAAHAGALPDVVEALSSGYIQGNDAIHDAIKAATEQNHRSIAKYLKAHLERAK